MLSTCARVACPHKHMRANALDVCCQSACTHVTVCADVVLCGSDKYTRTNAYTTVSYQNFDTGVMLLSVCLYAPVVGYPPALGRTRSLPRLTLHMHDPNVQKVGLHISLVTAASSPYTLCCPPLTFAFLSYPIIVVPLTPSQLPALPIPFGWIF